MRQLAVAEAAVVAVLDLTGGAYIAVCMRSVNLKRIGLDVARSCRSVRIHEEELCATRSRLIPGFDPRGQCRYCLLPTAYF